ncbi:hypothetical protein ES703_93949 [subsurface metagenome]
MKRTIPLILVLALGLATKVANADFTFGTPTNLGPTVNSSAWDAVPNISADGLSLFLESNRPGGSGGKDVWVTTRQMTDEDWGIPVNLGPTVNSSSNDGPGDILDDGLTLFLHSDRTGGSSGSDLYVTTRNTTDDDWGEPLNLGPTVNSSQWEFCPIISADGLTLFFCSNRSGGSGLYDLWVTTRATRQDDWGSPVNLGPTINTSSREVGPDISADGLTLYFFSDRPGGYGDRDLWMATRSTTDDPWGNPVNLGPRFNTPYAERAAFISPDGSTLYFSSDRPGGVGDHDIWQAQIIPIVDFNGDGIVDCADIVIMIDYWGTDNPLCDIGPMPWGDGIVDVQDLIVLAEHLFEGIPPVEHEESNIGADDNGSQVELEQGRILVITLESNPSTGYRWEQVESQETILEQIGEAEFKPSDTGGPPLVGAGGWEIFRFKAISAGQMTLQLVYHRPWEEGVEPINTFSIEVIVN